LLQFGVAPDETPRKNGASVPTDCYKNVAQIVPKPEVVASGETPTDWSEGDARIEPKPSRPMAQSVPPDPPSTMFGDFSEEPNLTRVGPNRPIGPSLRFGYCLGNRPKWSPSHQYRYYTTLSDTCQYPVKRIGTSSRSHRSRIPPAPPTRDSSTLCRYYTTFADTCQSSAASEVGDRRSAIGGRKPSPEVSDSRNRAMRSSDRRQPTDRAAFSLLPILYHIYPMLSRGRFRSNRREGA
jgi:hypothetical protein